MRAVVTQNARYLRIREDGSGRTIEAWVIEDKPTLPPPILTQTHSPNPIWSMIVALSFIGWGFCGVAIGNYIFFGGLA